MANEGRHETTTPTARTRDVDQEINDHQHQHLELRQQQQKREPLHMHVQGHHHHHHHEISFGDMRMQSSSSSPSSFFPSHSNNHYIMGKDGGVGSSGDGGANDFGDLDQALFLYLDHDRYGQAAAAANHPHQQDQKLHNSNEVVGDLGIKPPTLNIFPSHPMHSTAKNSSRTAVAISQSSTPTASASNSPLASMDPDNNTLKSHASSQPSRSIVKREGNRIGSSSSSDHDAPKTPDPKTLRRLAQNREAARKSRLRKKAYVQQLESSRIRLSHLEQELQRARAQGIFFGGGLRDQGGLPVGVTNISTDAAMFDLEYARWLEEHHRMTCELRAAVQEQLPENELKIYVDNCLAHYDAVIYLKTMVSKADVFHIVSGMWKTPAERCFLWMGGFRPSEVIKIILHQIEPLTEQQLVSICQVQQSTQEAEEALSQGLEALNHSLSDTITSNSLSCPSNMNNYMGQMVMAINKLSTLEGFVRQADSLRQQTLHRLHQILTTHQAARCFLAIAEYFHRLRALSSLWLARPRQD